MPKIPRTGKLLRFVFIGGNACGSEAASDAYTFGSWRHPQFVLRLFIYRPAVSRLATPSMLFEEGGSHNPGTNDWQEAIQSYRRLGNHWIRYRLAASLVSKGRILDVGCGHGLGASLLANGAREYVGVDSDREAIAWAQRVAAPNLQRATFSMIGELENKEARNTFDLVTAFEVIEHVRNPREFFVFLSSLAKKPGGLVLLSTPNGFYSNHLRHLFRTPYHVDEYSRSEMLDILNLPVGNLRFFREFRYDRLDVVALSVKRVLLRPRVQNAAVKGGTRGWGAWPRRLMDVGWNYLNQEQFWTIRERSVMAGSDLGGSTLLFLAKF